VLQADLLTFARPQCGFDVIVLSLVLNFAGDPATRGAMLVRAR
jgi:hypothetical protein